MSRSSYIKTHGLWVQYNGDCSSQADMDNCAPRHKRLLIRNIGRVLRVMYYQAGQDTPATQRNFTEWLEFGEQHLFDMYVLELKRALHGTDWHPLSTEFKELAVTMANSVEEMEAIIHTLESKSKLQTSSHDSV